MRVAVIGLGGVGEACAHLLVSRGTARTLVLANRSLDIADAIRQDLEQSRPWSTTLSARAVAPWTKGAFDGCDVVVLTAGPRLRGNETRADKAAQTAALLTGTPGASIVESLSEHVARAAGVPPVLLVVTNPVEATVTWLAERTRWPRARIIGLGTTVETARFSRLLADRLDVDAASVWTEILGEHGQHIEVRDPGALRSRVASLSSKQIDFEKLLQETREAAGVIRRLTEGVGEKQAKSILSKLEGECGALEAGLRSRLDAELSAALSPPATRFAIAAAVLSVVEAIDADSGRILPVSGLPLRTFVESPEVALALPFVLGRAGLLAQAYDSPSDVLRRAADSIHEQVEAMRAV